MQVRLVLAFARQVIRMDSDHYNPTMAQANAKILDTQVISYGFRGRQNLPLTGMAISSITANEFLLVQNPNPAQANYYVPLLSRLHFPESPDGSALGNLRMRREHPFRKTITDQVTFEFNNEFPSIIEYGNVAIALLINERFAPLFYETINFLDSAKKKTIRKRFDFLLENEITCRPLTKTAVVTGMELLEAFRTKHNLKANFRNSLNDMLVFATAIDASAELVTADKLLARFAAEYLSSPSQEAGDLATVDFRARATQESRKSKESKGYINKSWQFAFKNYRGAG